MNKDEKTKTYCVICSFDKVITSTAYISSWLSKGLSGESVKPPVTSDNSLTLALNYYSTKRRVKFTGNCLEQPPIWYIHGRIANIYIVYELDASSSHVNDPTLKNCWYGAGSLTKNGDIDNYGYCGSGIGFDRRSSFSFPGTGFGQNVLIFGVDMSFSSHIDNKKKDILVLEKGTTQGLEDTNLTVTKKKLCLSCIGMEQIAICLSLVLKFTNLKQKILKL